MRRIISAAGARRRPDLRRIHHSILFWIGAVLFLAAMAIYLGTEDLSIRPRPDAQAESP